MVKIVVNVFFVVVAAVIAYAIIGCQLEMVENDSVMDAVDVAEDTTGDSLVEVDVAQDTTETVDCAQFTGYWQCFCQSGLCTGELWKNVEPCVQCNCATVTDVTEVDSESYQADCADVGTIEDGVLVVSDGKTVYWCVPAPPP